MKPLRIYVSESLQNVNESRVYGMPGDYQINSASIKGFNIRTWSQSEEAQIMRFAKSYAFKPTISIEGMTGVADEYEVDVKIKLSNGDIIVAQGSDKDSDDIAFAIIKGKQKHSIASANAYSGQHIVAKMLDYYEIQTKLKTH